MESATATACKTRDQELAFKKPYSGFLMSKRDYAELEKAIGREEKKLNRLQKEIGDIPRSDKLDNSAFKFQFYEQNLPDKGNLQQMKDLFIKAKVIESQDFFKEAIKKGFSEVVPGSIIEVIIDGVFCKFFLRGKKIIKKALGPEELFQGCEAVPYYSPFGKAVLDLKKGAEGSFINGARQVSSFRIISISPGL